MFKAIFYSFVPFSLRTKKDISQDIVLITGGASGLGQALAKRQDWPSQNSWSRRLDASVRTFTVDITNHAKVYEVAAEIKREIGTVTILVHNAGIISGKSILELDEASIERTFKVNVISHFWTLKAFLPGMMTSRRGHVVAVSSIAGKGGVVKMADYSASKAAAVRLDECVRLELGVTGYMDDIKCTLVLPGAFDSGMFAGFVQGAIKMISLDELADQVMVGILLDRETIVVPSVFSTLGITNSFFPYKCNYYIREITGINQSMDAFVGRQSKTD
ncbi:Epidermal retinol dehydrogenase 2 [Halotydeus destructor]|nr:Epidermal retinol dehydrogenase 2 [Halotydeus destructor]